MTQQRSIVQRAWIIASKPFVVAAWRVRERRRYRRNFPIEWKTPGEIITLHLENYEDEKDFELNKALVEDLLPARDAARARSDKLTIAGLIIFAFLAADYFAIGIKISIPGIALDDVKGAREFLIFFGGILSTLSLIAQNNQYTLDSTIKYIVNNKYPEIFRQIYISKYFWHDNFPRYFPVQTPHLSFTSA